MVAGETAFFRGGVYDRASRITLTGRSGQKGEPLRFLPYQNEHPVIDFSRVKPALYESFFTLRNISHIHMDGLEIRNGGDPHGEIRNGVTLDHVTFSTFENLDIHHIAGNAFQFIGSSHHNLIENNDIHENVVFTGSHADGVLIGHGSHDNILRGNRSYHNNDDGFDTWEGGGGNLFENNWAFGNGKDPSGKVIQGDGNGFKLGKGPAQNTLIHNLSWDNKSIGFTENVNSSILTLYNNTSYDNNYGFAFWAGQRDILRNNIAYSNPHNSFNGADDQYNSWNLRVSVSAGDFVTLDDSANRGPRQADGSLPESQFLHLVAGSDLIDKGLDVQLPYNGSAPDLGAYESAEDPGSLSATRVVRTVAAEKTVRSYGLGGKHEVSHYTEKEEGNSVAYYPSDIRKNHKSPLIFFAPGWGSRNPSGYQSLLTFIASHGNTVIYAKDKQDYSAQHFLDRFEKMLGGPNDILPYVDTTRIGVIGHSSGGGDTFKILDYFSKKGYGKKGRFLLALDPWFAFDMDRSDMRHLPSNTHVVILQFGKDGNVTDPRIPLAEYRLLTSIADSQKDYQVFPGANHGYPAGSRPYREMQGVLKTLDALMDYTFHGTQKAYHDALGVGSDKPVTDGLQKVKPVSEYPYKCNSHANEKEVLDIDYCAMPGDAGASK